MPTDTNVKVPQESVIDLPWVDESTGLSLMGLLLALAERKWFILLMTLAGGLIMAGIAILLPPTFKSTASILPPQQQQSTASAILGQLGPLAAAAGSNLGIKTPADLYLAILGSRTTADELIQTANLRQVYDVPTLFEARKELSKRTSFSSSRDALISVTVEDRDPKRAAALANGYMDALYRQNSRLALTEASQRRLFFERQLEVQKAQLATAEMTLKTTQEKTGVLQVNSQVEAVIRSMAQLRAEIASREVALASLKNRATGKNPEVIRQEEELAAMGDQLHKLESSTGSRRPGDPMIPTSQVPNAGLEYLRSLRDLKYNEALFELISKQYEAARLDEAKEAPIMQVVDTAVPSERKSWPPRAGFTLAGAFGSALVACLIVLHLRDPKEAEKFHRLKSRMLD